MFKIPKGYILNKHVPYASGKREDLLIYDGEKFIEFASEEGDKVFKSLFQNSKKAGENNV